MNERPFPYAPGQIVPGTQLRIVRQVGRSGRASVFEVEEMSLGCHCILKAIQLDPSANAGRIRRMKEEAKVLGRLRHPNLAQILWAGVMGDGREFFCYVLEHLDGHTLRRAIRANADCAVPFTFDFILRVIESLLRALAYAHAHKIVHGAVQPENVFLHRTNDEYVVKLLDAGIATHALDRTPTVKGLRAMQRYAAPEQIDSHAITPMADVYAAGLTLYELIAGRGPFDDAGSEASMATRRLGQPAPPVSWFRPDVPHALDDLLGRMLERHPARRPADMMALVSELEEIRGEVGMGWCSGLELLAEELPAGLGEPSSSNAEEVPESLSSLEAMPPDPSSSIQQQTVGSKSEPSRARMDVVPPHEVPTMRSAAPSAPPQPEMQDAPTPTDVTSGALAKSRDISAQRASESRLGRSERGSVPWVSALRNMEAALEQRDSSAGRGARSEKGIPAGLRDGHDTVPEALRGALPEHRQGFGSERSGLARSKNEGHEGDVKCPSDGANRRDEAGASDSASRIRSDGTIPDTVAARKRRASTNAGQCTGRQVATARRDSPRPEQATPTAPTVVARHASPATADRRPRLPPPADHRDRDLDRGNSRPIATTAALSPRSAVASWRASTASGSAANSRQGRPGLERTALFFGAGALSLGVLIATVKVGFEIRDRIKARELAADAASLNAGASVVRTLLVPASVGSEQRALQAGTTTLSRLATRADAASQRAGAAPSSTDDTSPDTGRESREQSAETTGNRGYRPNASSTVGAAIPAASGSAKRRRPPPSPHASSAPEVQGPPLYDDLPLRVSVPTPDQDALYSLPFRVSRETSRPAAAPNTARASEETSPPALRSPARAVSSARSSSESR